LELVVKVRRKRGVYEEGLRGRMMEMGRKGKGT